MENTVSMEIEQLRRKSEQQDQKLKRLGDVINQLQEELRQKRSEVAEMEAEYPPDDSEMLDSTEAEKKPYMTKKEMETEFKRHLARLVDALDSVEFSKDWAVDVLDRYDRDSNYVTVGQFDITDFMAELYVKADTLQAEICHFMDMVRDVQTIAVDEIAYPIKKYSEDK